MKAAIRHCAVLVLAALPLCAQAQTDLTVYHYRENTGVRVYTDRKPENIAYVQISKYGRPTATASCTGLTAGAMNARVASYDPLISKYAKQHGVRPGLVRAVMRVESCFDRRAISRVGARGLMQLMPGTAAQLGVQDSFDAEQNIRGGVQYLSMMLQRFNQDSALALAAYNAGPEAVAKHKGIPPFVETRNYVKRVLETYRKNP